MKFLTILCTSMVILQISNGYPQREALRPRLEDQEAEPSDTGAGDDSDMYMEAMEPEIRHIQPQQPEVRHIQPQQLEVRHIQQQAPEGRHIQPHEPEQGSQNVFPAFTPYSNEPLGHSRPFYYQPEAAYSHRPTAYQQHVGYDSARISGYKGDIYEDRSPNENSILGSGNFGVIKGGTFYNDKDGDDEDDFGYEGSYSTFYQNGHGRPSYYFGSGHRGQQQEQFENFRDFADINTPSYSHFVVVYANKNGTVEAVKAKEVPPKNILEHLAMLDLEVPSTTELVPEKKISKNKRKLALLLPEKKIRIVKHKATNTRDSYEPLLALS